METIKISHSLWRMLLLTFTSLVFVLGGIFMLENTNDGFHVVVAWLCIVFFGLCGLYMLYSMLKERLMGKPFMTITDEGIIIENAKQKVIRFADVESFELMEMRNQQFIAVHYKSGVEQQKLDEAGALGRSIRNLNRNLVNAQETFSTVGTDMKAEVLCELLNERLGYSIKGGNT